MKELILALPSILLVGVSNAILKWRQVPSGSDSTLSLIERLGAMVRDPYIIVAAVATLASVLWWLSIVSKVRVSVVYPAIQGGAIVVTLVLVTVFLSEKVTTTQLAGIAAVIAGIFMMTGGEG